MSQNQLITVAFNGQTLLATLVDGKPYVAMKPICENIGLQWESQYNRIKRHKVMSKSMSIMEILSNGGIQTTVCLPLSKLNGWLFGVDANRVKEEIRPKLERYQEECFEVLDKHFMQPTAPYTVQPTDTLNEAQQIALRTLLEANVKRLPHGKQAGAMVQGWSKLKAHFGVPYRQIPAHEFTEALSIVARHVAQWELTDESPKLTTAPQPVTEQPTMRNRRWLLTTEADGREVVQAIGPDDFVTTWPSLTKSVATGECLRANAELLDMASACMHRLQQRSTPAIAI